MSDNAHRWADDMARRAALLAPLFLGEQDFASAENCNWCRNNAARGLGPCPNHEDEGDDENT
jgi:hypothetical protein